MGQRLRVVGTLPDRAAARIADAWPTASVSGTGPVQDGDAVLAWDFAAEPLLELLADDARPQWVHTRATGVDPQVLAAVERSGAVFTCGRGGHGQAVAEHVLALVLAHFRRIPDLLARQARREWNAQFTMDGLHGRLVGVLGAGDLGGTTAELLKAFGVRLRVLRRVKRDDDDQVYGPADLERFLSGLEVLVVAVPLTADTTGMLSEHHFTLLSPGCLLVNVGRAAVVDQDAMIGALRSGRLGGAALDVFAEEPLPPSSPLWELPGVIVSPHCADTTPSADARMLEVFLAHVARFRDGLPLLDVVVPERGY